jgi:hypothetical protein
MKHLLMEDLHPCRKLSALPTVLRLNIVSSPEIYCLDIQAWIRETEAPVVPLRGIDGMDNWHFCQLVATLKDGHTVSCPSRWLPARAVSHCDSTPL